VTEPDRILTAAEAELANVRRLVTEHAARCTAPRDEPGSLTGACPQCRSLAVHLERCRDQVDLLASGEAETESLF
jgi:hypothetical protein